MEKLGYIGQGYVGKTYADEFENRGFEVVRYSLEESYKDNAEQIAECDIVFIAVPTPTVDGEMDISAVREGLEMVADNTTVVIKSTLLPGTTRKLQSENPRIFVLHSPEFLRETSAEYDASHPSRNIVGIPEQSGAYEDTARHVLSYLPQAPYQKVCSSEEAELIKYTGNCFLYSKVVFMNLIYDLASKLDADYHTIAEAVGVDPRIGESHMLPVHKGGPTSNCEGRGAGGNCFLKDFAAFREFFGENIENEKSNKVLRAIEEKNIELLKNSEKDLETLKEVYGEDA